MTSTLLCCRARVISQCASEDYNGEMSAICKNHQNCQHQPEGICKCPRYPRCSHPDRKKVQLQESKKKKKKNLMVTSGPLPLFDQHENRDGDFEHIGIHMHIVHCMPCRCFPCTLPRPPVSTFICRYSYSYCQ